MTDYQIEQLLKIVNQYLASIFPAFIWLIVIPALLCLFFFIGRGTALGWLVKHHLKHIKSEEVHNLTMERDNAIREKREAEIELVGLKKKFNTLNMIFNSKEL